MVTFYESNGISTFAANVDSEATGFIGSFEAGAPIPLGFGATLEPQAQLVYQHLDFTRIQDVFSTVDIHTPDTLAGRIGVRLAAEFGPQWRPYLKAYLWNDWQDGDRTIYSGIYTLGAEDAATSLEVGGGLVGNVADNIGVWAVVDYTTQVAGAKQEIVRGNAGLKVNW